MGRLSETIQGLLRGQEGKSKLSGECLQCGKCCRNIILIRSGRPITSMERFEKLKKRVAFYQQLELVCRNDQDGLLYFSCKKLGTDGRCSDYQNRPKECRTFPQTAMFRHGGKLLSGCGYQADTAERFEGVLEQALEKRQPQL